MSQPTNRPDPYDDAYGREGYGESPYNFTPFDHIYFWSSVLAVIAWVIVLGVGAGYLWAKHGTAISHAVRTTLALLLGAL